MSATLDRLSAIHDAATKGWGGPPLPLEDGYIIEEGGVLVAIVNMDRHYPEPNLLAIATERRTYAALLEVARVAGELRRVSQPSQVGSAHWWDRYDALVDALAALDAAAKEAV
jgi:hypothetical protein